MKGKATRWNIIGEDVMNPIWESLDDTTRPIQEYVTEYSWGEIFSRKGLSPQTRILLNLAILCSQGELTVLRLHIRGAVHLGCTKVEIREALIQASIFAGFSRSAQACKVAQEVFLEMCEETPIANSGDRTSKEGI